MSTDPDDIFVTSPGPAGAAATRILVAVVAELAHRDPGFAGLDFRADGPFVRVLLRHRRGLMGGVVPLGVNADRAIFGQPSRTPESRWMVQAYDAAMDEPSTVTRLVALWPADPERAAAEAQIFASLAGFPVSWRTG